MSELNGYPNNLLPKGWLAVKVSELGKIETGSTPSKKNEAFYGDGFPFYKPTDLEQGFNVTKASDNLSHLGIKHARYLPEHSILVTCIGATIGKAGIIRKAGACNQQINAIIPTRDYDSDFIYYQVISSTFQKKIKDNASSTTLPILNKSKFQNLDFVVCPLKEQQEIVSKIEELFSELDKSIEQLKTAQQQLTVYRQSVLKWAFVGSLTSSNSFKQKALGDLIEKIEAGKSFRCDEREPRQEEVGVLKVSAVTWGEFDESESKTVIDKSKVNANYFVKKEDFLLSRANTIDLVGAAVIVRNISKKLMLSDKTLRITFDNSLDKAYVLHYLRSRQGRKQIEQLSTGNQESMRNIGQERIKQIKIPYCSIEIQRSIVQEIEGRLSEAERLEETITDSLQQAEALRQSILRRAFDGRLIHKI